MVLVCWVLAWLLGQGDVERNKFKPYPLRMAVLTTIYSFGLYKWWIRASAELLVPCSSWFA
ncbi:hypothetical protein E2562_022894 [Oryza meyeriana var. granulata]|uniref:Uncharacterized protein n=1 Tax=Oryza meyeriana var. granulata TaxID=110450 RepID=A0A6G1D6L4_9ORYZ|nr:hypothetical protein E2562_022894 [Oryza meyeriana var. granulata]